MLKLEGSKYRQCRLKILRIDNFFNIYSEEEFNKKSKILAREDNYILIRCSFLFALHLFHLDDLLAKTITKLFFLVFSS
jgi:hypothetical protein